MFIFLFLFSKTYVKTSSANCVHHPAGKLFNVPSRHRSIIFFKATIHLPCKQSWVWLGCSNVSHLNNRNPLTLSSQEIKTTSTSIVNTDCFLPNQPISTQIFFKELFKGKTYNAKSNLIN